VHEAQDVAAKSLNAPKAECTEKVVFEQRIKDKIIELETSAKNKTASLMTFAAQCLLRRMHQRMRH